MNEEKGFMIGEEKVLSMRYKDIFRKPLFWIAYAVLSIFQIIKYKIIYTSLLVSQIIGIFAGCFLIMMLVGGIVFQLAKLRGKNKQ